MDMASSHAVDLDDAKDHLPELVTHATDGEEVILTRGGLPVAKIVPFERKRGKRQFGSARGMFEMAPDFDDPLEDVEEDL
jgi:prevent-host-death family protein